MSERTILDILAEGFDVQAKAVGHAHAVYHRGAYCCNPDLVREKLTALAAELRALAEPPADPNRPAAQLARDWPLPTGDEGAE